MKPWMVENVDETVDGPKKFENVDENVDGVPEVYFFAFYQHHFPL